MAISCPNAWSGATDRSARHVQEDVSGSLWGGCILLFFSCLACQRLLDVRQDVFHIFDADGEAYQVRSDACLLQLLVAQLTVRVAGRVEHTGARVRHVRHDADHLQAVHEVDGILACAFQSEGYDAARAVGEVFLRQFVVLVALQSAIVYPGYTRMLLQVFSYRLGVAAVLGDTQMEGLQSEIEQERVLRRLDGTEVAHQLCRCLGDVCHLAECLRVGQPVVRGVGLGQSGELVGMCVPVEIAAVDDCSAHTHGVSVHILGRGVGHDVGSPFKRTAVDRGSERVVDNQGYPVAVGDACELLDVEHLYARVGDGLAEEGFGVRTEGLADFLFAGISVDEGAVDAHLFESDTEEVERAAIDCRGTDEVVAGFTDVVDGIEVGCLSRGGQHGAHAAFECGNLGCHGVVGRVLQTGIEIAVLFQVEEACHLFAAAIFEGGALVDGEYTRLSVLGCPSCLDTQCAAFSLLCHNVISFIF